MLDIVMTIIFWFSIFCLVHTYFIYPALLALLSRLIGKKNPEREEFTPNVSLIIAAYNEEDVISRRIENALSLDYPKDKLEIIISSDGSTDRTNEIVSSYNDERVVLKAYPANRGRAAVHNDSVKAAKGEIVVFSDANTIFDKDFLRKLVRNFTDPKVGCVSGRLHYLNEDDTSVAENIGLYWKQELFVLEQESKIGTLFLTSGACMAIRKDLFRPIEVYYDIDFICPLDVILQGYRVIHEPEAIAYDTMPSSIGGELKARTRIATRNLAGILSRKTLLNPLRHPIMFFSILSHKLIKYWGPFFIIVAFLSNALLLDSMFYRVVFVGQLLFYIGALIGWQFERKGKEVPILSTLFSFLLANIGFFRGSLRVLLGRTITTYKSVK